MNETDAAPPPPPSLPPRARLADRWRNSPIWQVCLARLRDSYRRPETIFWVYLFPIMMIVALGIAFRNQPLEAFVVDVQAGPGAERLAGQLREHPQLEVAVREEGDARRRLRAGRADVLVLRVDERACRFLFDPTRAKSQLARNVTEQQLQVAAGRRDPVVVADQAFEEPGGRYIDFLVPGLLGMSIMGGGLWGVGFAIVDMRIRKLLKTFLATPMRKSHFLLGMMLSRLCFMVPEMILLLVFSYLFFGVVIYGSLWLVVGLILLGACTFSGVGLLVASRAETLETVSGLMNLVMLPMWMLCGIFFSPERFPKLAQPVIQLLPLTPLIAALRGVMLEAAGPLEILPQIGILAAWAVLTFALALSWFRWS